MSDTSLSLGIAGAGLLGRWLAWRLARAGHAVQAVSTAVNAAFVARAVRSDRVLPDGDRVLLFQPIVGG